MAAAAPGTPAAAAAKKHPAFVDAPRDAHTSSPHTPVPIVSERKRKADKDEDLPRHLYGTAVRIATRALMYRPPTATTLPLRRPHCKSSANCVGGCIAVVESNLKEQRKLEPDKDGLHPHTAPYPL
jgi:hypothetical protein